MCKPCQAGRFSNETELTSCFDCPSGQFTHGRKGSASCESCAVGTYGNKCDECEKGWHIECLPPPHGPLKSWPSRGFKCPDCAVCNSCGTTHPKGGWYKGYEMCTPCGRKFAQERLAKHQKTCLSEKPKERKIFNGAAQRLGDFECVDVEAAAAHEREIMQRARS